jgi:transcriptional regulator with XRE-family HTH domain
MLRLLGLAEEFERHYISGFERGEREPPLEVLLRYSEVARVWINALVDDRIDLPEKLPAAKMHEGIRCPAPRLAVAHPRKLKQAEVKRRGQV